MAAKKEEGNGKGVREILFRVPEDLLAEVDAHVDELKERKGPHVSRNGVLVQCVERGLRETKRKRG